MLNKMVARALDQKYIQKTSAEPLIQIQNHLVEMFLIMSPIKKHKLFYLR